MRSATMRFIASKKNWTGSKWRTGEGERSSPALIAGRTRESPASGLSIAAALAWLWGFLIQISFLFGRFDQVVVVLVDRLPVAHLQFSGLCAVLHLRPLRVRGALARRGLRLVGRLRRARFVLRKRADAEAGAQQCNGECGVEAIHRGLLSRVAKEHPRNLIPHALALSNA